MSHMDEQWQRLKSILDWYQLSDFLQQKFLKAFTPEIIIHNPPTFECLQDLGISLFDSDSLANDLETLYYHHDPLPIVDDRLNQDNIKLILADQCELSQETIDSLFQLGLNSRNIKNISSSALKAAKVGISPKSTRSISELLRKTFRDAFEESHPVSTLKTHERDCSSSDSPTSDKLLEHAILLSWNDFTHRHMKEWVVFQNTVTVLISPLELDRWNSSLTHHFSTYLKALISYHLQRISPDSTFDFSVQIEADFRPARLKIKS